MDYVQPVLEWIQTNGLAVVIVVVVGRWLAPRIDVLLNRHLAFLDKTTTALDRMTVNGTAHADNLEKLTDNQAIIIESQEKQAAVMEKQGEALTRFAKSQEKQDGVLEKVAASLANGICNYPKKR